VSRTATPDIIWSRVDFVGIWLPFLFCSGHLLVCFVLLDTLASYVSLIFSPFTLTYDLHSFSFFSRFVFRILFQPRWLSLAQSPPHSLPFSLFPPLSFSSLSFPFSFSLPSLHFPSPALLTPSPLSHHLANVYSFFLSLSLILSLSLFLPLSLSLSLSPSLPPFPQSLVKNESCMKTLGCSRGVSMTVMSLGGVCEIWGSCPGHLLYIFFLFFFLFLPSFLSFFLFYYFDFIFISPFVSFSYHVSYHFTYISPFVFFIFHPLLYNIEVYPHPHQNKRKKPLRRFQKKWYFKVLRIYGSNHLFFGAVEESSTRSPALPLSHPQL
jgi:hypothetical protein